MHLSALGAVRRSGAAAGALAVVLTLLAEGGAPAQAAEQALDVRISAVQAAASSRGRRDPARTLRRADEARAAYQAARERASLLESNAARLGEQLARAEALAAQARARAGDSPDGLVEAFSDLFDPRQSAVEQAVAAAGNLRLVQSMATAGREAAGRAEDEADRALHAWMRAERAAARVSVARAARQAARRAISLSQPLPTGTEADPAQRRMARRALRAWEDYLRSLADAEVVPPPAVALADPSRLAGPLTPARDSRGWPIPGVARVQRREGPSVLVLPAETVRAVSEAFGLLGQRPPGGGSPGPESCAALATAAYGATDVDLPVDIGAQWQRSSPGDARQPQPGDLVFTRDATGRVDGSGVSLGSDLVIGVGPQSGVTEVRRLARSEVYGVRRATVPLATPAEEPPLAGACAPEVPPVVPVGTGDWMVPLSGDAYVLSSGFGSTGSLWSSGQHTGQDFETPVGTPVLAGRGGVVTVEYPSWAGTLVRIDHGDGVESWYAHLSAAIVTTGSDVEAGDPIGSSGNEGNTTGPHLHFEIRVDGVPVDPMPLLQPGYEP